jgi:hypothetical protein
MFFPPPPRQDHAPLAPGRAPRSWQLGEWAGRHRWRFAALFALCVFGVFSFLPAWRAIYIGDWEASGEPATFWAMLASVPRAAQAFGPGWVLDHCWFEPVKLVALLAVGLGLGLWLGERVLVQGGTRRVSGRHPASVRYELTGRFEPVYNLEVHGDQVYRAGDQGFWCITRPQPRISQRIRTFRWTRIGRVPARTTPRIARTPGFTSRRASGPWEGSKP